MYMAEKVNNLQDIFLNSLRKSKTPVTMFLIKGVKLQGIITWFDNFSVLLRRDGQSQLVYKHAISTVMPAQPMNLSEIRKTFEDNHRKPRLLQEKIGRAHVCTPVTNAHLVCRLLLEKNKTLNHE